MSKMQKAGNNVQFTNQQKRMNNIRNAEGANKEYFRRIRISDYISGQAIYGLGDYPAKVSAKPTEYDRKLIAQMAENGVKLIQLHEEWNDACRLYGADKFSAVDEEGMKEFVALCHSYGIRVIAYMSTCYFPKLDADYKADFQRKGTSLAMNYMNYVHCNHGSASWREYCMNRMLEAVDRYGFDGIFNDVWHDQVLFDYEKEEQICTDAPVVYDPDFEDMIYQLYSAVKKRGGIYKLHMSGVGDAPCRDKVYDYMWVGEGLKDVAPGLGKDYMGYVVPCLDRHWYEGVTAKTYFAYTIPFMQFPLLKIGRPIMGQNVGLRNVTYYGGDEEEFYAKVGQYMRKNPDGPYVYSLWSSIPDDPTEFDVWSYYMKLYAPMTTQDSLAYIEIRKCDEILSPIPERVYASMFVNEESYLVLSNLTDTDYTLQLKNKWKNRETGVEAECFDVKPEELIFLIKV